MNLKILSILLIYYTFISMVFLIGGDYYGAEQGYKQNYNLDSTELGSDEKDTGGLFGSGVSFTRFFGLVTIGVGLPSSTSNGWVSLLFALWQTGLLIFSAGFVIDSIWGG